MACLRCVAESEIGALCRPCALQIPPCPGLIPDHIHSRIEPTAAHAWVVDGFGGAHAIGACSRIGRSHDRELLVLASSVSRDHAELRRTESGWIVRDLGSRNGTFVDCVRSQGPVELTKPTRLKVADIALWFLPHCSQEMSRLPRVTPDGNRGRLATYQLERGDLELCIVAGDDRQAPGPLLWRRAGAQIWTERGLSALEFQLLRALCRRAHEDAALPLSSRGCVSTKQLLTELPFVSRHANHENVRQVVLRLRGALTKLGASRVVAVAPGRGYYLTCRVSAVIID